MSKIKQLEEKLKGIVASAGYDLDSITFTITNRPDLGEYQINDAMKLAKIYHKSPIEIANDIKEKLDIDSTFTNVNIAGAGFINLSLSDNYLAEFINEIKDDIFKNVDKKQKKTIIIDYGGANVAKTLHVGHLRSANIGEALKRLARTLGHDIKGDVHLGDSGLQAGTVILEMKSRFPELICFSDDYDGRDFDLPITTEDLKEIYPCGSAKVKENEELLEKAREITLLIQKNHLGYSKLWDKITNLSVKDITELYTKLNTEFELWETERDSFKYIPELLEYLNKKGLIYTSEGAKVMDIKEDTDNKEMPPVILEKSDGAYLYSTTDLATIYGRIKRFSPDEIWYLADNRQELHFNQVFRAAKKAGLVPNTTLEYCGFGTMNGADGKPFKTRAGGVMSLEELINIVNEETYKRINIDIVSLENREQTSLDIAISTLKYADLLPFRNTDYIFDPSKFSELEGKTAPYLLYSTVRMKSLLKKAKEMGIEYKKFNTINGESDREIILTLLNLPTVLQRSYDAKSLNELAEYIYKLTSTYNKFYSENRILTTENETLKSSWLILSEIVYNTNNLILNILGLKCPEKM